MPSVFPVVDLIQPYDYRTTSPEGPIQHPAIIREIKAKESTVQPSKIEKNGAVTAGLFYLLILVAQYYQLLGQDFILLDDYAFLVDNTHIHNGLTIKGVWWAFTTTAPDYWHPMIWLSYMTDISLFGFSATTFKLVNAFLHYCNAFLLFLFLRKTTDKFWPSLVVGALLIAHPLHVESVAWATERKDVLFLFFGMLSLHAYYRFVRTRTPLTYILSLTLFICGLLAKTTLATLPALMLLLDYWPLGRIDITALGDADRRSKALHNMRTLLIEKTPFLLLGVAAAAIARLSTATYGSDGIYYGTDQFWIADWLYSYVLYVWKLLMPIGLVAHHPLLNLSPSVMVGGGVALLLGGSILALLTARRAPYITTGCAWFAVALFPGFGVFTVAGLHASMYDRFTYLPAIGLYTAFAFGLWELSNKRLNRVAFYAVTGSILLTLSFLSWKQAGYWKNTETLFLHALKYDERNWIALKQLAQIEQDKGNYTKSTQLLNKALAIEPGAADIVSQLAKRHLKSNEWHSVHTLYKKHLELYPKSITLLNDYGSLLIDIAEYESALEYLNKALETNQQTDRVHHNLATCYFKLGDLENALKHSTAANQLKPGDPNLMFAKAVLHAYLKETDKSKAILLQIIKIDPTNKPAKQALRSMGVF